MRSAELLSNRPEPGVAVLTLNRPERLNAITMSVQEQLDARLGELESDGETRCIVLTGSGDRAFSAGYDVREMSAWSADGLLLAMLERERWIAHLALTEVPIVVALNGLAYGIGAVIASLADVRIGCPEAIWRFSSAQQGGAQATWILPSLVGRARAGELLLTAREVGALEAERIGLLDRVVPKEKLLSAALATASAIAANPRPATRAIKRLLHEHVGRSIEDRFVAENIAMRTELRPRPVGELYASFLADDGTGDGS